jgi:hypothetical protein
MPGHDDSYGSVHESSSRSLGTSRELPGRGRGALYDGSNPQLGTLGLKIFRQLVVFIHRSHSFVVFRH